MLWHVCFNQSPALNIGYGIYCESDFFVFFFKEGTVLYYKVLNSHWLTVSHLGGTSLVT